MNFRDIELLSSYLDGQLNPSDSARLEARLSSDTNLRAAMDDLREARSLLRRLPARKAPRNFTLTRQMVGLKPPLPRAYSGFRFATALATLLLVATVAINVVGPRLVMTAASPALYGQGGGGCDACGGGAPESEAMEAPATEAPAAEAPAATEPPAAPPSLTLQATGTAEPSPAADTARVSETPELKEAPAEPGPVTQGRQAQPAAPVPVSWQLGLAVIAILSAVVAFIIRRLAMQKWK